MNEMLQQLLEFVQDASPVVWSALIRQVCIEAWSKVVWAVGLAIICVMLAKLSTKLSIYGKKQYDDDRYSDWETRMWFTMVRWFTMTGSALAGLTTFGLVVSAIMRFSNPEFYAIRFIIEALAVAGQ